MSKYLIGAYGIANYINQKNRQISSQTLVNMNTKEVINPKEFITIDSTTEFKTNTDDFIIVLVSPGTYFFYGIGQTNKKCMIRTNEEKILIYSKGDYDIKLVAPNYKKIKLESVNNKVLIICYWDYMINEITSVITKYFKNVQINFSLL